MKREKVEFGQAGAEWVAYFRGNIIASVPVTRGRLPPRWFKQTARQYAREALGAVV